jgi:hypothetical protein
MNNASYISLTDIARFKDEARSDYLIQNWMRTRSTVEFLGIWEKIHNPDFKSIEFDVFKNEAGANSFSLTPKKWVDATNALGIVTKKGRYGGGTLAHPDIAFEFAGWISAEFKLYVIKEFQRLKQEENDRLALGWDSKRMLTKINYKIHTDSIRDNIITPKKLDKSAAKIVYASEADILNLALFGMTAKEWKDANKSKEGNIRDYADVTQLVCLANLESLNSILIKQGVAKTDRFEQLHEAAEFQMRSLSNNPSVKKLAG